MAVFSPHLDGYIPRLRAAQRLVALCFFACVLALGSMLSLAEARTPDVRVLVDISGSMRKNDPQNLRVPAVKLLANMMPAGSEAGVWTFARYVNMLIKHGVVDLGWKTMATNESGRINSVGMYTDIGAAIDSALVTWKEPDPTKHRSLILLTDGMVDVPKSAADSEKSRKRIIDELIPKLKAAQVRVHTIALSDNADKALLQSLSVATDGLFSVSQSSADLLKVFLQAFDQSVEQDEVPMEGNRFHIDNSVEEFTVLVFRVPGSQPTKLRAPNGTEYTQESQTAGLNWFHDGHYDLITITDPAAGEWNLIAQLDPENRVTVVSDLELKFEGLPSNILKGDELVLEIALTNEGETVVQPEFLSLIDLTFRQEYVDQDKVWEGKLTSSREGNVRTPKDGKYAAKLGKTLLPGQHEFSVVVDGRTFQRKRNHRLMVHGRLVEGIVVEQDTSEGVEYFLNIVPIATMVDTESVEVTAEITTPQENVISATPSVTDFGTWKLPVPPSEGMGLYRVALRVRGTTLKGREVDLQQAAVMVPYVSAEGEGEGSGEGEGEEKPKEEEPEALESDLEGEGEVTDEDGFGDDDFSEDDEAFEDDEEYEEEELGPQVPEALPEHEPVAEDESMSPLLLWGGIALANILLFGVGFFVYRKISKKNKMEESASEANLNASLAKAKEAAAAPEAKPEPEKKRQPHDAPPQANDGNVDDLNEATHVDGVDLESDLSEEFDDDEGLAPPEIDANDDDDDDMSLDTDIDELTDLDMDDLDSELDLSDTSDLDNDKP